MNNDQRGIDHEWLQSAIILLVSVMLAVLISKRRIL